MQQHQPSNSQEPTQLLALPPECLEVVLQRLKAPPVLRSDSTSDSASVCSAARAHSRLHAAAAAALSSISAKVKQLQLDSLLSYLERHGRHVTSLALEDADLEPDNPPLLSLTELPGCRLRSLSLGDMSVQLGASSDGHQGVLQAVPQLSKLELEDCTLLDTDSAALTAALAGLTALQHLHLCNYRDTEEVPRISIGALTQQQLTHLEAPVQLLDDKAGWRQQLRSLSQLRELGLQLWEGDALRAGDLDGLIHITRLEVESWNGTGSMAPECLVNLPNLRHLVWWQVDVIAEESPTEALLQQLGRLQQLTCLRVGYLDADVEAPFDLDVPPAAYKALMASTQLQLLDIAGCQLPEGALAHVWSAQRPALQELALPECVMHLHDVEAMVAACPGLQRLELFMETSGDEDEAEAPPAQLLAPLSGLSQLTELTVGGVDDAAAAAVLATLTDLCSLDIRSNMPIVPSLSLAGRLALTQLQGLTSLSWYRGGPENETVTLDDKAPDGSPPDVWRQLLEHCQQQDKAPVEA